MQLPITTTTGSSVPAARRSLSALSKRTTPKVLMSYVRAGSRSPCGGNATPAKWTTTAGIAMSSAAPCSTCDRMSAASQRTARRSTSDRRRGPSSSEPIPVNVTSSPRASSARANHCPTNPPPPVRRNRVIDARCSAPGRRPPSFRTSPPKDTVGVHPRSCFAFDGSATSKSTSAGRKNFRSCDTYSR